jgi:uncharacterized protein (DUF2147 family)
MLRNLAAATVFFATLAMSFGNAATADAVGTWTTEDAKARVRITHCGGAALCGAITWLKEPIDPETGQPKTDRHNADAAQRNRALVGTQILLGMKPSDTPGRWEGHVYNAEDGKVYTGYLTMQGPAALKLEGCILGGLICKSQIWTRAE